MELLWKFKRNREKDVHSCRQKTFHGRERLSAASGGSGADLVQYSQRKMAVMVVAQCMRARAETCSIVNDKEIL